MPVNAPSLVRKQILAKVCGSWWPWRLPAGSNPPLQAFGADVCPSQSDWGTRVWDRDGVGQRIPKSEPTVQPSPTACC